MNSVRVNVGKIIDKNKKCMGIFIQMCFLTLLYMTFAHAQVERWVCIYEGQGNSPDYAHAIVYGMDGNIYVAGQIDSDGTDDDFTVVSLTPSGTERWVYTYNGPGNNWDRALSLMYGTEGNIYISGTSYASSGDFTVISLTSSGSERWVYTYDGTGGFNDFANSVVSGADGNIYAAGQCVDSSNHYDFTVISLDSMGTERWCYLYNGSANYNDGAHSVVYGLDGNIYVAGSSNDSLTAIDFTVVSLTPSGDERWVYKYNGPENGIEGASSIVYGSDGNIYIAGQCYNSSQGGLDYFTVISLTTSGTERWVYRFDSSGHYWDGAMTLVYGLDGNIYAAGESQGFGSDRDFTVICLTPLGSERWVYTYNGPGNFWDWSNTLVYGLDENIYAAGRSMGISTWFDFIVIKLDTMGAEQWVYRYDRSENGSDEAYSITYGADNNIYVAGYSEGELTYYDFTVISLNPVTCIEEQQVLSNKTINFGATIFSGPLLLPESKKCKVFDITGRVVMSDKVKPGIYFIEIDGVITRKVVKVK